MEVTEGEKLTPARNGAAQVGGFQRGQRRDLVRLDGEDLAPWAQSTALVQPDGQATSPRRRLQPYPLARYRVIGAEELRRWSLHPLFPSLCCHSDTSLD